MHFIDHSAQQKFTLLQRQLDDLGFMTHINRIITGERYEVIVNGEVKKVYKTRRSAKSFIIKLYQNEIKSIQSTVYSAEHQNRNSKSIPEQQIRHHQLHEDSL